MTKQLEMAFVEDELEGPPQPQSPLYCPSCEVRVDWDDVYVAQDVTNYHSLCQPDPEDGKLIYIGDHVNDTDYGDTHLRHDGCGTDISLDEGYDLEWG
jgi:hypothetical protein